MFPKLILFSLCIVLITIICYGSPTNAPTTGDDETKLWFWRITDKVVESTNFVYGICVKLSPFFNALVGIVVLFVFFYNIVKKWMLRQRFINEQIWEIVRILSNMSTRNLALLKVVIDILNGQNEYERTRNLQELIFYAALPTAPRINLDDQWFQNWNRQREAGNFENEERPGAQNARRRDPENLPPVQ